MALELINVFIDTSTFEKLNFNWQASPLHRLAEHARDGRAVLHVTKTTISEISDRIRRHAADADRLSRELANKQRLLGQEPASTPNVNAETAMAAAAAYFSNCGSLCHGADGVDCDEMMQRFFDRKPPFSSAKRLEFPDAVAALSLRAWARSANDVLLIVSEDTDWLEMSEEFDEFQLATLAEVLGALESRRSAEVATIQAIVQDSETELLTAIRERIESTNAILVDRWEDEADTSDVRVVDFVAEESTVIEVERAGTSAKLLMVGTATIEVDIRYGDDNMSSYDSEDKQTYFWDTVERTIKRDLELFATFDLEIDLEQSALTILSLETNMPQTIEVSVDDEESLDY